MGKAKKSSEKSQAIEPAQVGKTKKKQSKVMRRARSRKQSKKELKVEDKMVLGGDKQGHELRYWYWIPLPIRVGS